MILDALPVPPIGKIFKPALQQREITRVIRQEALARALGRYSFQAEWVDAHARRLPEHAEASR